MSARLLAATVALFAAAPLAAQEDTGMMVHDTGMMAHDTGMMAPDTGNMSSDSGMMDHGMMKDEAMGHGGNMMFLGADGSKATGDYEVVEVGGRHRLTLTSDFAVADAPDLYLLLSSGPDDRDALTLGKLKRPAAGQSFDLPKGKDLSRYSTLVVWSRKEKRAVATAEWHAPEAMAH
jgi:electron transfer DM13